MDLDTIRITPPRDLVLLAAGRRDVFALLWLLRSVFRVALDDAIALAKSPTTPYHNTGVAFIARSLEQVRNADEFVALSEGLKDDARGVLLEIGVKSYSLDPRVLVTLLEDGPLLERLVAAPLWCSDALWVRANWLFHEYPSRRFTLNELVPAAIPVGTRARAVLGAALDDGRLTDDAIALVRAMYSDDAYIQQKTVPKSSEASEA